MRTTSSLESMNAVLRQSFPNHPHIFKFIDRLKLHEFSKTLDMLEAVKAIGVDSVVNNYKKKDQKRRLKINRLTLALQDGSLTTGQFLEAISSNEDENIFPVIGRYHFSHTTLANRLPSSEVKNKFS